MATVMCDVDLQRLIFLLLVSVVLKAYGSDCPKVHGGDIIPRSLTDSTGWTMLNTGNPITCDGYVTAWRFYPTASAEFLALVMRPHIAGSNQYVVVGRTVIPKQQVLNTAREFTLPETDWISVKIGDVIGFKFETAVLARDNEGTMFIFQHGISQHDLLVHTVHTINGGSSIRTQSFQAVLKGYQLAVNEDKYEKGNSSENLYGRLEQDQVSRYNHRMEVYGKSSNGYHWLSLQSCRRRQQRV
ncbi:uncharacterized protein [Antedon mediterranea]|uniref:uncharacterized protein n=1 Tax=Antedon mediterranea TaxID=105859 RepID=UPI003AF7BC4B